MQIKMKVLTKGLEDVEEDVFKARSFHCSLNADDFFYLDFIIKLIVKMK